MVATVIGGVISLSLGQQGPPRLDGLVRERYCLITKVSITPSCVGVGFHESGCTDLPERVQSQAYPGSHRTQCCLLWEPAAYEWSERAGGLLFIAYPLIRVAHRLYRIYPTGSPAPWAAHSLRKRHQCVVHSPYSA